MTRLTWILTITLVMSGIGAPSVWAAPEKPNIVYFLVDNIGLGELSSYDGGITRGAETPRIDKLATEGTPIPDITSVIVNIQVSRVMRYSSCNKLKSR